MTNKMHTFELAIRTIDGTLTGMSTESLQKWHAVIGTLCKKIEKELTSTMLHTCTLCFMQEYGYREEPPANWYFKGDSVICFQHEYAEAEKELKIAGKNVDAFLPPEAPRASVEQLQQLAKSTPKKTSPEDTLEELMSLL